MLTRSWAVKAVAEEGPRLRECFQDERCLSSLGGEMTERSAGPSLQGAVISRALSLVGGGGGKAGLRWKVGLLFHRKRGEGSSVGRYFGGREVRQSPAPGPSPGRTYLPVPSSCS